MPAFPSSNISILDLVIIRDALETFAGMIWIEHEDSAQGSALRSSLYRRWCDVHRLLDQLPKVRVGADGLARLDVEPPYGSLN